MCFVCAEKTQIITAFVDEGVVPSSSARRSRFALISSLSFFACSSREPTCFSSADILSVSTLPCPSKVDILASPALLADVMSASNRFNRSISSLACLSDDWTSVNCLDREAFSVLAWRSDLSVSSSWASSWAIFASIARSLA